MAKRTSRPETASGATFTIWLSTNASSVSEWSWRNANHRSEGGSAIRMATPIAIAKRARRDQCRPGCGETAGGETTTVAGVGFAGAAAGRFGFRVVLTVGFL